MGAVPFCPRFFCLNQGLRGLRGWVGWRTALLSAWLSEPQISL